MKCSLSATFVFLLGLYQVQGFRSFSYHKRAKTVVNAQESQTSTTDVTFVVPRFYDGDVKQGTYPSPLHQIHVKSVLSDQQATECLQLARAFAAETGRWDRPDSDRHATYATCDFAVEDCEQLNSYVQDIGFHDQIWAQLSQCYGVSKEDMTYLDLFCAHYRAKTNDRPDTMDRLEAHRDGSLLSFTVTLTPPSDFEGGGTFFDALRDVESDHPIFQKGGVVKPSRAGDVVLHSGKLLHGADVVRNGERTVLVGFVDVADWCQRPGALATACRDWGRLDVAKLRQKRQMAQTEDGKKKGWLLNNARWLPSTNLELDRGRSHIQGFCPAFSSVARRADNEYQRRKKLEAEDILLRTILLSKGESVDDVFGGDITIL